MDVYDKEECRDLSHFDDSARTVDSQLGRVMLQEPFIPETAASGELRKGRIAGSGTTALHTLLPK